MVLADEWEGEQTAISQSSCCHLRASITRVMHCTNFLIFPEIFEVIVWLPSVLSL